MTRKSSRPKVSEPYVYAAPLAFNDIVKCITDGKLSARVAFLMSEAGDRREFDQSVEKAFPGFTLSDIQTRYVGCDVDKYIVEASQIRFDITANVVKYIDPDRGSIPGKVYNIPLRRHELDECTRDGAVDVVVRIPLASVLDHSDVFMLKRVADWLDIPVECLGVGLTEIEVVGYEDHPEGEEARIRGYIFLRVKALIKKQIG